MNAQLYRTQWGWGAILWSPKGLKEVFLPKPFKEEVLQELPKGIHIAEDPSQPVLKQFIEYFAGQRQSFEIQMDLDGMSEFQKKVYEQTVRIPYGETRSYQSLAQSVGTKQEARAVARALSQNPIPIVIPCHRVIQKNGKLGGFSGGVTWKSVLLDIERSNETQIYGTK